MKHKLSSLILLFLTFGIFTITSCGKKDKHLTKHIPEDAGMVISLNIGQVLGKVDLQELRKNFFIKMFEQGMMKENMPNFLEDPEVTGLDLNENIYIIFSLGNPGESTVLAEIRKKKDFRKFAEAFGQKVESADDYDFIRMGNDLLAWDGDIAIMITGSNESVDGMKKRVNELLTLSEEESIIGKHESFDEFVASKADLAFWAKSDQMTSNKLNIPNPSQLSNFGKGHQYMTLNFEPGQVHVHGRYFPAEEEKADMKQLFTKFDESLLQMNLPSDGMMGFLSLSMNPETIKKMMESQSEHPMQQDWLLKLTKYLKGDVFIGVVGVQDKIQVDSIGETDFNFMPSMPEPVIYATFTFRDTTGLDSLFALAGDTVMIKKEGYYDLGEGIIFFRSGMRGYVTNSRNYQKIMNNPTSGTVSLNDNERKLATTYPFVLFIDMDKVSAEYMKTGADEGQAGIMKMLADQMETVEVTAEPYNNKYLAGDLYIRMKDKEMNSLQALVNMIMKMMSGMGGML